MSLSDYVVGLGFLLGTLIPIVVAAWLLTRRRFGHLTGAPRVLCFALLALTGLIGVHMVAGVLTVLSRTTVLIISVVAGALVCLWAGRLESPPPAIAEPSEPPDGRFAFVLAVAAVAGLAVYTLGLLVLTRNQPLLGFDALWYRLPGVARWMQTQSFWDVQGTWMPNWAFGHYPANGDVVQLSVVLPWSNDALVRFVAVPFLGLAGLSTYAIARELRAPRSIATISAVALCTMPVMVQDALRTGKAESIFLTSFGVGVLFLLRHSRSGDRGELVLAGLGLGIAFGTKWYGVTYIPIVIGVWAVASVLGRRPLRQIVARGAALSGVVFAAGGFWLVRNLVQSGSPFFPAKVDIAGLTIFDAPPSHVLENGGYSIAHYLDQPSILRQTIAPQLAKAFGLTGILLGAALIVVAVIVLRRPRANRAPMSGTVLAMVSAAVLVVIAYLFTPFSASGPEGSPVLTIANARYALPAFLIATVVAAWAVGRSRGAWRAGLVVVGAVAILESMGRTNALSRGDFPITPRLVLYGLVATGALAAVASAIAWIARDRDRQRSSAIAVAAVAIIAVASVVIVGGHRQQRAYNAVRYRLADPVYEWIQTRAPSGHRIGLVGEYARSSLLVPPPLPLFGPRLRNDVRYVGPFVRGMLEDYQTQARFVVALNRGRFDLLVVALGDPPQHSVVHEDWARSAGFVELTRSPRFVLFGSGPMGFVPA